MQDETDIFFKSIQTTKIYRVGRVLCSRFEILRKTLRVCVRACMRACGARLRQNFALTCPQEIEREREKKNDG